jgi:hypothetical protein
VLDGLAEEAAKAGIDLGAAEAPTPDVPPETEKPAAAGPAAQA